MELFATVDLHGIHSGISFGLDRDYSKRYRASVTLRLAIVSAHCRLNRVIRMTLSMIFIRSRTILDLKEVNN